MEIFTKDWKVANLIRHSYQVLPLLNRFGIKLGVKDKTIEEICAENALQTNFVLAILNTYVNPGYFPRDELLSFSPGLLVNYLKKTHVYYLEYVLPKLEKILNALVNSCTDFCSELRMIEVFYKKYRNEFIIHIKEEEDTVFPYIIRLVEEKISEHSYSISLYEKGHSNIDDKLNDLLSLIIKYLHPSYDENLCNEFLSTLFRFEKDVKNHSRIEDNILIPMVMAIEKEKGL